MIPCRELIILSFGLAFHLPCMEINKVHEMINSGTTFRLKYRVLTMVCYIISNNIKNVMCGPVCRCCITFSQTFGRNYMLCNI